MFGINKISITTIVLFNIQMAYSCHCFRYVYISSRQILWL